MGRLQRALALLAVALSSHAAIAGDIYVCKGAKGVKSYQNTPCPTPGDQLGHGNYDNTMARAPAPSPQYGQTRVQQRAVYSSQPPPQATYAAQPIAPAPPSAYQCVAGDRRWIQPSPCPATYTVAHSVDVDGITSSGEHVDGTGTYNEQKAVQQNNLDQTKLCEQLEAHATVGEGYSDTRESYERTKIKRDQCGG